MISKLKEIGEVGLAAFVIIGIMILILAVSWGCTCLLVWLITLCFDIEFSLLMATGVWLVIILLQNIFSVTINNNRK